MEEDTKAAKWLALYQDGITKMINIDKMKTDNLEQVQMDII
jgi:hypothetical protein